MAWEDTFKDWTGIDPSNVTESLKGIVQNGLSGILDRPQEPAIDPAAFNNQAPSTETYSPVNTDGVDTANAGAGPYSGSGFPFSPMTMIIGAVVLLVVIVLLVRK